MFVVKDSTLIQRGADKTDKAFEINFMIAIGKSYIKSIGWQVTDRTHSIASEHDV
jgi:hypothetical protein